MSVISGPIELTIVYMLGRRRQFERVADADPVGPSHQVSTALRNATPVDEEGPDGQ